MDGDIKRKTEDNECNKRKEEQDMDTGYSWIILLGEFEYLFIL